MMRTLFHGGPPFSTKIAALE
ncbi:hypothetical protein Atc_1219 [Acidithiobacillus caldus SM-1]|uniref:Uncharacterized protein n=1 Tax=Acidithiobacillus caldus (strain SM-1) TaxID=990288 RepID=F9ZMV8_ACICS|nr:hypothetical protein Atc_1219 [Acidithiobacillus caldus SM-1]